MRTRDLYATLRELVPTLVDGGGELVVGWTERADPIWRRGDRWVRVEIVTTMQLLVIAGQGDKTLTQRTHLVSEDLPSIALEVAQLLSGVAPVPAP
jgi:hypothetical protein